MSDKEQYRTTRKRKIGPSEALSAVKRANVSGLDTCSGETLHDLEHEARDLAVRCRLELKTRGLRSEFELRVVQLRSWLLEHVYFPRGEELQSEWADHSPELMRFLDGLRWVSCNLVNDGHVEEVEMEADKG